MQKCPNCLEFLADDVTKCPYCGEQLVEKKPVSGPVQPLPRQQAGKDYFGAARGVLFFFLSILFSLLILPLQHTKDFPLIPAALIILGTSGMVLSLILTPRGSSRKYPLLALCLPALIIGAYAFSKGMISYNSYRREDAIAQQKLLKQKADKKKELEYIQKHREELYQQGLAFFNEQKYPEAREKLARVLLPDRNYKDAAALLAQTEQVLSRMERERRMAEAKDNLAQAEKLLKSESCRDYDLAVKYAKEAKAIPFDEKKADRILVAAQLQKLMCYEGNDQLTMAIQIQEYRPLKLAVWVKNVSTGYREANPGFFSLVTVTGRSYKVSSVTYDLRTFFDAVYLKPGDETGGSIVFDTYDKPKKLTYTEMKGTSVSREFPFDK